MAESQISKELTNRIGRAFAMLFTRSTMYNLDHPFTIQSITEFHKFISRGLDICTPVVLIMHQDQFFIEEEQLDPRINTSKMLFHFKKGAINSISFDKGLGEDELTTFTGIFIDIAKYIDADAMKEACAQQGVNHIKINHVFYKKVTADDEVVDRKVLESQAAGSGSGSDSDTALEVMAESILMEELEKSLSIGQIINNPQAASQKLIDADVSTAKDGVSGTAGSGSVITQNLQKIRSEVETATGGDQQLNMQQLAEAVFDMKRNLLKGIEAQKAEGVIFQNEAQIIDEADELTDNVLVQLIREEYQQGKISVQRLAQIVRRLIPEQKEIQRMLPKIKNALLEEGMALTEFLQLTQELKKELQSEGLANILEKSAEDIGVSGDELVREISQNPKGAVELIYLASEIRKGTGDDKVLSDLLVDYVERVSSKMTLDVAEQHGVAEEKQLRGIIAKVENKLLKGLNNKDIDTGVIRQVARQLNDRFDESLKKLESQWSTLRQNPASGVAADGVDQEQEQQAELDSARESASTPQKELAELQESINITLPKGVLNRNRILHILEKEIARSKRYDTPFSILMLSIFKITPDKKVSPGEIPDDAVMGLVLEKLANAFREADFVGLLDNSKVMAVLPMTAGKASKKAMGRILKCVHEPQYKVNGIPLTVKLAGTVSTFDKDRTSTPKEFLKRAESDIYDMVMRLQNLQNIY